jgi:uncharacterized protein
MSSAKKSKHPKRLDPNAYRERSYRRIVNTPLIAHRVIVQETDIHLYTDIPAADMARETIITQRGFLEKYIQRHPEFVGTLDPWPDDPFAPTIVQAMIRAGRKTHVGPMAAVAGAMAEQVGGQILSRTPQVVVENGGDIYFCCPSPITVAVFAGASPLSLKIGLRIQNTGAPQAICTSSGTVGHSLSFGRADAVCVLSSSCPLADAAATAIGNRVKSAGDIQSAIAWARELDGISGVLLIVGAQMGAWGRIEIVPL